MDPFATQVLDWRKFALAFALPSNIKMPDMAQLSAMGEAFAAASTGGAVTAKQFASVPLWFEDDVPEAATVSPEAVETGAPVIGGHLELPEPSMLRQVLFRMFSSKHVGPLVPESEPEPVEGDVIVAEESVEKSAAPEVPRGITEVTIGANGSLAFVEMLLYLCFDDTQGSGVSKAEAVLSLLAQAGMREEGAEAPVLLPGHSEAARFMARAATDKSHFSRKSLRFHDKVTPLQHHCNTTVTPLKLSHLPLSVSARVCCLCFAAVSTCGLKTMVTTHL
jgi:hypothetical protein